MGLLSLFQKKSPADLAKKHGPRATDKRAYPPDRWESIRILAESKSKEAAEALLPRFTFRIDPSITDQEEKDLAFRGIVDAGESAVPAILEFMRRSDTIAWPLRMLTELLPEDRVTEELLVLLESMDLEYTKDPQKKIQVLSELEHRRHPRIAAAAERFFADVSEPVRFHAVGAYAAQEESRGRFDPLQKLLFEDESARVRAHVLDACIAHGFTIPADVAHLARAKAPAGYSIDAKGSVSRANG